MTMSSSDNHSISMAVDLRKFRFRIHRNTLHALGNPTYVQLMFDPEMKAIMLMAPSKGTAFGQEEKVIFDHSGTDGSFELYSKTLIQKIQRIFPNLQDSTTYLLYGKLIPSRHAVYFPLNSLHRNVNCEAKSNVNQCSN